MVDNDICIVIFFCLANKHNWCAPTLKRCVQFVFEQWWFRLNNTPSSLKWLTMQTIPGFFFFLEMVDYLVYHFPMFLFCATNSVIFIIEQGNNLVMLLLLPCLKELKHLSSEHHEIGELTLPSPPWTLRDRHMKRDIFKTPFVAGWCRWFLQWISIINQRSTEGLPDALKWVEILSWQPGTSHSCIK